MKKAVEAGARRFLAGRIPRSVHDGCRAVEGSVVVLRRSSITDWALAGSVDAPERAMSAGPHRRCSIAPGAQTTAVEEVARLKTLCARVSTRRCSESTALLALALVTHSTLRRGGSAGGRRGRCQ